MLQFMPLLIEIILLAATAYLYWLTRKSVANSHSQLLISRNSAEIVGVEQAEMMQEVSTLLDEWHVAASAAREDWLRQQANLREVLGQAETTIAELRHLITQSENLKKPAIVAQKSANEEVVSQRPLPFASPVLSSTLGEIIEDFSHHLQASDYSEITITRTISRTQHFITWLVQNTSAQGNLGRITPDQIDNYSSYLTIQTNQADLNIGRELSVIKVFASWINERCDCQQLPDTVELSHSSVSISPSLTPTNISPRKIPLPEGADRYRSVFALADQGLDPVTITAQTGLEREAVRLLLSIGSLSQVKH